VTGLLWGVGVGPGDEELLTLRAVRLIGEADVVFVPRGRPGRARSTAARWLEGKRVVELDLEMRGDRERAMAAAAATVGEELSAGVGVYLTEGDPSLYSTFQLLRRALAEGAPAIDVRAVPGVCALTAAAAAAGAPLAMGEESLAVIPASASPAFLDAALASFDSVALLKPSMGGEALGERLRRAGRLGDGSALVIEAIGAGETVRRAEAALEEPPPYFATWLVRGGPGPDDRGRVHFVGAGPGGAGHLTGRALSLLRWAGLLVAADSLVAHEVIALARSAVVLSSGLTLEETVPRMIAAARAGQVVVRLHSGDPSLYGAVAEQMAMLREAGCRYEVTPGVSSVFAAAAALGVELTEPAGAQTVILTRHGRRVPTPDRERLCDLAAHGATLAVFLSATSAADVQRELLEAGLDPATPAAVAHRVAWPDEVVERTTVAGIADLVRSRGLLRHTLILVGEALDPAGRRSRLYDSGHVHIHRRRSAASAPALTMPPALVAVTRPGGRLARRLARDFGGPARVMVPAALVEPGEEALGLASEAVPRLFSEGSPLVLLMALGAAARLLGPVVADKRAEPPVVVVDDAGRFAISLLGGRAAGANRLAEWVAAVLGAQAVVTTAAELLGLPALDEAIAEAGWRLPEAPSLRRLEAAVVNGDQVGFYGPGHEPPAGMAGFRRVSAPGVMARHDAGLAVTDRELGELPPGWALARPRRLALGFGCATGATGAEAERVVLEALAVAGLAPEGVGTVATIDRRSEHPAARWLSDRLGAPLVAFTPGELGAVTVPNPSVAVAAAVGTASVAEAAAILAAGGGRLVVPKRASGSVTVAVAEAAP
jgi:precorrin-4 C11-methyltransferase/precorrin-2 C(20)-methyltransferase